MGKLFNLKKWLTIPDTAKHLSIIFGEVVTEADILRLALDGHLKLSVNLINYARARVGEVVDFKNTQWELFPLSTTTSMEGEMTVDNIEDFRKIPFDLANKVQKLSMKERAQYSAVLKSLIIDNDRYLNIEQESIPISDIWDLPMIGNGRNDIEHQYQKLTDGPAITLRRVDSAFLQKDDATIYQLQESFDDNEYNPGSKAQLKKIKDYIAESKIDESEAKQILDMHSEARKEYLERIKENPESDFLPAQGLPQDAVLVVRTDELRRFESTLNENTQNEKPLNTTERNTLLTIIAAMCKYEGIDPKDRTATSEILKMTEDLGAPVSDDTIRSVLKKIPNAIDSRIK